MKTRLAIFTFVLLLLPLTGLWLSGTGWNDLVSAPEATDKTTIEATLRTTLMMLFYVLLVNHTVKRMTGKGLLGAQRDYFLSMSIIGAMLCWLLSYLNIYVASWTIQQETSLIVQLLLYTPLFALLAPAVLVTRSLFASMPGLLKFFSSRLALPELHADTRLLFLVPIVLFALLGGAAWPTQLFWLFWLAPLLLLVTLQLLWNQATIFSTLKSGDWARLVCTALSGLLVGNLAVFSYEANTNLQINLPNTLLPQFGFMLFGLLCLQLGDVIAENWHGKKAANPPSKKKFPIPVVVVKK